VIAPSQGRRGGLTAAAVTQIVMPMLSLPPGDRGVAVKALAGQKAAR
jgi:hypothetical protein